MLINDDKNEDYKLGYEAGKADGYDEGYEEGQEDIKNEYEDRLDNITIEINNIKDWKEKVIDLLPTTISVGNKLEIEELLKNVSDLDW